MSHLVPHISITNSAVASVPKLLWGHWLISPHTCIFPLQDCSWEVTAAFLKKFGGYVSSSSPCFQEGQMHFRLQKSFEDHVEFKFIWNHTTTCPFSIPIMFFPPTSFSWELSHNKSNTYNVNIGSCFERNYYKMDVKQKILKDMQAQNFIWESQKPRKTQCSIVSWPIDYDKQIKHK